MGTNDASGIVCALGTYISFSSCFLNILTNNLILAQGGLMTTVGVAVMKMTYLVGVAGVQT
jgi:hypothetical protein